jgi:hypothetical protein
MHNRSSGASVPGTFRIRHTPASGASRIGVSRAGRFPDPSISESGAIPPRSVTLCAGE